MFKLLVTVSRVYNATPVLSTEVIEFPSWEAAAAAYDNIVTANKDDEHFRLMAVKLYKVPA